MNSSNKRWLIHSVNNGAIRYEIYKKYSLEYGIKMDLDLKTMIEKALKYQQKQQKQKQKQTIHPFIYPQKQIIEIEVSFFLLFFYCFWLFFGCFWF